MPLDIKFFIYQRRIDREGPTQYAAVTRQGLLLTQFAEPYTERGMGMNQAARQRHCTATAKPIAEIKT